MEYTILELTKLLDMNKKHIEMFEDYLSKMKLTKEDWDEYQNRILICKSRIKEVQISVEILKRESLTT